MTDETLSKFVSLHEITKIFAVVLALELRFINRVYHCEGECMLNYVCEVLERALACNI